MALQDNDDEEVKVADVDSKVTKKIKFGVEKKDTGDEQDTEGNKEDIVKDEDGSE